MPIEEQGVIAVRAGAKLPFHLSQIFRDGHFPSHRAKLVLPERIFGKSAPCLCARIFEINDARAAYRLARASSAMREHKTFCARLADANAEAWKLIVPIDDGPFGGRFHRFYGDICQSHLSPPCLRNASRS